MRYIICALLFAGCVETEAPTKDRCVEFDHVTQRAGKSVTCRMVWCEKGVLLTKGDYQATGGVATLWCDGADSGVK